MSHLYLLYTYSIVTLVMALVMPLATARLHPYAMQYLYRPKPNLNHTVTGMNYRNAYGCKRTVTNRYCSEYGAYWIDQPLGVGSGRGL